MSHVNTALQLAELGYRVFPCRAGTKLPATMHGHDDATTDQEKISEWWSMWPEANIGVNTEGLLVIDLDPMEDGSQNVWLADQSRMDSLQRGAVSVTPRGGRHCWFRQPAGADWRCRTNINGHRVDTRANGGYVVVPPSITDAGRYEWLPAWELTFPADQLPLPPAWVIDLLASVETRRRPSVKDSTQQMREGSRNDGLTRHAGAVRRLGWTESEIRNALKGINETRCVPPLDEKEVDKIAWSVARYEPDQVTQAIVEGWAKEDVEKAVAIPDPGPLDESFCGVPGLIGEVISYNLATAHRPQPVLALAGAIALMGTITGRRITDRLGTRTNIYTMGVAGSGRGKEHARKVNKLLLQLANLDKRIGPEDFGSHAGLICAVSDVPEILFQLDEMGRFMKTANAAGAMPHLSNVITVLLKMFTSSNSLFVGPAYAETNKVKRIEQPHACLYGTTVPESFFAALTTESIKDGFIGRLLAFEAPSDPPELVETATAEDRPPESLIEQLAWWRDYQPGGLLSAGIPRPRMIDDSPDARQQFRDFSADCEKTSATGGVREALWARAHEKARKLALLYAVSESRETSQVSGDAAVWGCQVVRHLTLRMEYLADRHIADGIFDSHGKRVYRLIDDAGPRGLTGTELCRATQAMKPRERSEVLDNLQSAGRVLMATKNGSGRRTHVYVSDRHA